MSSHHTQKAINLHHDQVTAGRERRAQYLREHRERCEARRQEARWRYWFSTCVAVFSWSYSMLATATYTGYVLNHLSVGV